VPPATAIAQQQLFDLVFHSALVIGVCRTNPRGMVTVGFTVLSNQQRPIPQKHSIAFSRRPRRFCILA
jgi:hypothetical protein